MPDTNEQNPTADYRKYPKGPRFGLIVALACLTLILFFVAAVLFLHGNAKKVDPHGPTPTPNSLVRPASPFSGGVAAELA